MRFSRSFCSYSIHMHSGDGILPLFFWLAMTIAFAKKKTGACDDFHENFLCFPPNTSELCLCGNSGYCPRHFIFPSLFMSLSFQGSGIVIWKFNCSRCALLRVSSVSCFMKHFSCDNIMSLKHPESSNDEIVIQGCAKKLKFFHISIGNVYVNKLISKSLNRYINSYFCMRYVAQTT